MDAKPRLGAGFPYRNIIKNLPEALWSPDPAPDARTAAELEAGAMPKVPMGVEVLPRECKQVPIDMVVHEIRMPAIPVPPRNWQKKREEREAYYEKNPAIKRDLFRDNLKQPKAEVMEAIEVPLSPTSRRRLSKSIGF